MKCEDCKKRESVLTYYDDALAYSHGWGKIELCRQCFIKRIEKHIIKCKKQLKEEKELFKKEQKED